MKGKLLVALLLGCLLAADEPPEKGKAKEKAVAPEVLRKELAQFQGRWVREAFEEDGTPTPKTKLKHRTLFCGGSQFVVKENDQIVQVGVQKIDPTKNPKAVDATVVSGEHKGETMLGIYQFEGDRLKVCFDAEGKERPTEFKTKPDTSLFLSVYQREKAEADEPDITGNYHCDGTELDGGTYTAVVEIERQGDAYTLRWSKGLGTAHIGVGLRKGNLLCVCWATKGAAGVSVYQIEKGPRLVGEWTELGGIGAIKRETLTHLKPGR